MNEMKKTPCVYLVSSCLMGLLTRYDGLVKTSPQCQARLCNCIWIPFCPEQLGGLPTPRTAADLVGGDGGDVLAGRAKVVTRDGNDVTENFIRGAQQVLKIAQSQKVDEILLKAKSPSCGLTPQLGVTAALLKQHGFTLTEY